MKLLGIAGFFVLACAPALAQTSQTPASAPTTTLSVENKLVVVPAVVRDKKGVLVKGLTEGSFALQVDGKPQPLRYFDTDADLPFTVGLLVDISGSLRDKIDDERTASVTFLDKMLTPERDQAFIIQFGHDVDLLQDVTMSRGKLQQALKELGPAPSFNRGGDTGVGDNGSGDPGASGGSQGHHHDHGSSSGGGGGGTALYDAVFLASDEIMPKQTGRRALILLTDGDDRGSKVTLSRSIEAAQRANTVVYAIYYKGNDYGGHGFGDHGPGGGGPGGGGPGGGRRGGGFPFAGEGQYGGRGGDGDGRKVLERMCGETGGRVFEVKGKQTVAAIYTEIAEELRSQYRLGFTPTAEAAGEGYHELLLTLTGDAAKGKNTVQAREGYYTK